MNRLELILYSDLDPFQTLQDSALQFKFYIHMITGFVIRRVLEESI